MREAGMRTWIDNVANVHGRVDGRHPERPALLMGSHYDTVVDAGIYDGALGIITAIAAVKALLLQVLLPSCLLLHMGTQARSITSVIVTRQPLLCIKGKTVRYVGQYIGGMRAYA